MQDAKIHRRQMKREKEGHRWWSEQRENRWMWEGGEETPFVWLCEAETLSLSLWESGNPTPVPQAAFTRREFGREQQKKKEGE